MISQRLTRSHTDKVIAGVCGGLGRYFSLDPVLVRLVMVALVFAGGISILIYPVLWLSMPTDTGTQPATQPPTQAASGATSAGYTMPASDEQSPPPPAGRNGALGALLLGVGILMLASMIGNTPLVFALLVLGGGVYLLRRK